jgi:hypothetical protein
MRRRTFLRSTAFSGLSLAASAPEAQAQSATPSGGVQIGWLGGAQPALAGGTSWGVPWPRGTHRKDQNFTLTGNDGKALPLQSWPMAYWPDGSLKWSGFATVVDSSASGPFRLTPATSSSLPATAVKVNESAAGIDVDTGTMQCRIPHHGEIFIDSMTVEGRIVARQGRLLCTLEDRSTPDATRLENFVSMVRGVAAEQTGPVRAVVRIDGMHKAEKGSREWLTAGPSVMRKLQVVILGSWVESRAR